MSDLAAFLLARVAEDEAAAREHLYYQEEVYEAAGWWDCDRVIAECEARRQIIALHDDGDVHECPPTGQVWPDLDVSPPVPCPTLRLLALPYADHPDYRQEWKP